MMKIMAVKLTPPDLEAALTVNRQLLPLACPKPNLLSPLCKGLRLYVLSRG